MAHIGVERFGAGDAEEDAAQHQKAAETVGGNEACAVIRVDRLQHPGLLGDAPQAERADGHEPQQHDRPERGADARGAERLHREQHQQNDHGGRHHVVLHRRRSDIEPFERRQHGNRRRDRAVAIDQRGAEQAEHDDQRTLPLLDAQERHQGEDAALAFVIDGHGDGDVFDRGDQEQGPDHQRQDAEDALRRGVAVQIVEGGFQRVERAGADIAEHDAERRHSRRRDGSRARFCKRGIAEIIGHDRRHDGRRRPATAPGARIRQALASTSPASMV